MLLIRVLKINTVIVSLKKNSIFPIQHQQCDIKFKKWQSCVAGRLTESKRDNFQLVSYLATTPGNKLPSSIFLSNVLILSHCQKWLFVLRNLHGTSLMLPMECATSREIRFELVWLLVSSTINQSITCIIPQQR